MASFISRPFSSLFSGALIAFAIMMLSPTLEAFAAAPSEIEGAARPPSVYTPPGLPPGSKEPDVPRGILAYGEENYALAYKLWLPLAKSGNPSAQYHIGNLYYFGKGREKSLSSAAQWFEKAAKQGHALAQHNLGLMILESQGGLGDEQLAFSWSLKSAYQGFPNAIVVVANSLISGRGRDQNFQAGLEWLYWGLHSRDPNVAIGLAGAWLVRNEPATDDDVERSLYFFYRASLMGDRRIAEYVPELELHIGVKRADEILRIAKEDAKSGSLSSAFQLP